MPEPGENQAVGAVLDELISAVVAAGVPEDARSKTAYFASARTEDQFLGVRVPVLRQLARASKGKVTVTDAEILLASPWHELRLLGGILLVQLYKTGPDESVEVVLRNTHRLDNWDLVDAVAPYTVGPWLLAHPERRPLLDELVASPLIWERRIALVATFALIRAGEHDDLLRLARKVLDDPEDLVHKAAGWMLREVGSRDRAALNGFLDAHAAQMPRVMLRYALEKHSPPDRRHYLDARKALS
jgi:3-methyladenine DNA glycosylase AlkD